MWLVGSFFAPEGLTDTEAASNGTVIPTDG